MLEGGVPHLLGQYFGGRSNSVTWSIYGREEGVTQLLGQCIGGREDILSFLVNIWEGRRSYSNTLSIYLKSIHLKNSKFFRCEGGGSGTLELEHVLSEQKLK